MPMELDYSDIVRTPGRFFLAFSLDECHDAGDYFVTRLQAVDVGAARQAVCVEAGGVASCGQRSVDEHRDFPSEHLSLLFDTMTS